MLICTEVDFSDFMQVASLKPAQWSSEAEDPAGRQERLAAAWLSSCTTCVLRVVASLHVRAMGATDAACAVVLGRLRLRSVGWR